MRWQGKSERKLTGGRFKLTRGKRKFEAGREQGDTIVAPTRRKRIETRGGNFKLRLFREDMVCVSDPKTGKAQNVKISTVVDNPANLNYIRRNIMTKGAVIKTEIGDVRITSRPSQDGVINAVLIS
jgi:small subunit ribosomal protein S8e